MWPARVAWAVALDAVLPAVLVHLVTDFSPVVSVTSGLFVGAVHQLWRLPPAHLGPSALVKEIGPLTTARLVIRPLAVNDIGGLEATVDDEVAIANGWAESDRRNHLRWAHTLASCGFSCEWVVVDRERDVVIGAVVVNAFDGHGGKCELGWWVAPPCRGRGLGTEAMSAVLSAVHASGQQRVIVGTAESNGSVRHVLEKLGAQLSRIEPHRLPDGSSVSSAWYHHDHGQAEQL